MLPWWWRWAALAAICAACVGFGYVKGLDHNAAEISDLQGQLSSQKAVAAAAIKEVAAKEKIQTQIKGDVDVKNTAISGTKHTDALRMRRERASQSYLPQSGGTSRSIDTGTICFDRKGLESAIQRLDDRVSIIVERCTKAIVDLDSGKEWVLKLKLMQDLSP